MAGFRIGRGRNNGAPQTRPQNPPYGQQRAQAPQGDPSYGYPQAPQRPSHGGQAYGGGQPYGGRSGHGGPGGPGATPSGWPQAHGGNHGEPEYFGDGGGHGYQGGGRGGPGPGHGPGPGPNPDPYAANNPGHTQAFSVDDPYHQGDTYRAGHAPSAPAGPRLHWKELLKGIVTSPNQTFLVMRDYAVWAPALIVTFVYGLLAVLGFDQAREDAIGATLNNAVPIFLTTAIAMVVSFFILGVVTHTLARQLGGDGAWQPTAGLSMLIMCITDAPRLVVAMFMGGDAPFVQILGWVTWVAAGALLTLMVSKSHDLPWPKALGASAIQLIAILSLIKLGTF